MTRSLRKYGKDFVREIDEYYLDLEAIRHEHDRIQSSINEKLDWIRRELADRQFEICYAFDLSNDDIVPYSWDEIQIMSFIQILHELRERRERSVYGEWSW